MTPKEKAKELVDKFRNELNWVEKDHDVDLYRDTRQCALIAVDEILLATGLETKGRFEFYLEVKKEIELL